MAFNICVYTIVVIYGLVIGSFLNVLILRIPAGEDFVRTRSHCVKCGYTLSWYDMIPVFSYLALRGRCRQCGEKISPQYPIVEALNAVLYVIVFLCNGIGVLSVIYCMVTSALLVIAVIDERTMEIPFGLTVFIGVMGIIRAVLDWEHISLYIFGLCSVGLVLEILFIVSNGRWIGGGDATLMMAAGLVLGWKNVIAGFFLSCLIGSVVHILRMKLTDADKVLSFGPYLAVGIYIMMLCGDKLVNWYVEVTKLSLLLD